MKSKPLYEKYERIRHCVVRIQTSARTGSGFLFRTAHGWLVVTAYHVVRDCHTGGELASVHCIGVDDRPVELFASYHKGDKSMDVAILRLTRAMDGLASARLWTKGLGGSRKKVGVGLIIASYPSLVREVTGLVVPGPVLQTTYVSGIGRLRSEPVYVVDCMVNPGSSGGPVFRRRTLDVIGVVTKLLETRRGQHSGFGIVVPIPRLVETPRKD